MLVSKWSVPTLLIFALILSGCSKQESPSPAAAKPAAANSTVDPATGATVSGSVTLSGKPPAAVEIDMAQDPACAYGSKAPNMSQQYVVNGGKLANVLVYVKSGLEGKTYQAPDTPVVLDQQGCRYVPHVLAMMVAQPLKITNSDPAMHNIHPAPQNSANEEWNVSQQPKGAPVLKGFSAPEVMMEVKCNQHPWMKAYLTVLPNPFFAVTDAEGKFEIKGLPPGTYTLAAMHEKAGEQTMQVTVAARDAKTADFTFKAQ